MLQIVDFCFIFIIFSVRSRFLIYRPFWCLPSNGLYIGSTLKSKRCATFSLLNKKLNITVEQTYYTLMYIKFKMKTFNRKSIFNIYMAKIWYFRRFSLLTCRIYLSWQEVPPFIPQAFLERNFISWSQTVLQTFDCLKISY